MRPANAAADHFDLLPFIAILMCVLGCLLLVTISMSSISVGVGAGEAWIPEGISTTQPTNQKIPLLVEWNGSVAVFHRGEQRIRTTWSPGQGRTIRVGDQLLELDGSDAVTNSVEFQNQIRELRELRDSHYVLIAVRPSGFSSLMPFTREFRRAGITIGHSCPRQS